MMQSDSQKERAGFSVNQGMAYAPVVEDEIDLLEYWNVLWKKRWLIVGVSVVVAVLAAAIAMTKPNIYRAEALLAPVGSDDNKGPSLGGLGGLASLAGVSLGGGGGGGVEENLAVLKSRAFIWKFVESEKLMPILFAEDWDAEQNRWQDDEPGNQPSLWDAWRLLIKDGMWSVSTDKDSGLITLAVEWTDAELATLWVGKLIHRLNQHLREHAIAQSAHKLQYLQQELARTTVEENRQALFGLISKEQKQAMLANTQQDFAFRVIDAAAVPDKKVKPKRALIVILSVFVAGFLCVVFVLIQEGIRNRKDGVDDE